MGTTSAASMLGMVIAMAVSEGATAASRPSVRDAEHYAFATCLTLQPSDYLKNQGYGLGAIVTNRVAGSVSLWQPLAAAVKAESARTPMTTIHGDGPVGVEHPMPIAHCLTIIDAPRVRAAVARVATGRRR